MNENPALRCMEHPLKLHIQGRPVKPVKTSQTRSSSFIGRHTDSRSDVPTDRDHTAKKVKLHAYSDITFGLKLPPSFCNHSPMESTDDEGLTGDTAAQDTSAHPQPFTPATPSTPSIPSSGQLMDVPFKLMYASSTCFEWSVLNIGVDRPYLNAVDLDVLFLVVEFFSMYYRLPEYGHPGVAIYTAAGRENVPYSGLDTRLFLLRPHVVSTERPHSVVSTAVSVDVDRGVYFRYLLDSLGSVKMECNVYDLAVGMCCTVLC